MCGGWEGKKSYEAMAQGEVTVTEYADYDEFKSFCSTIDQHKISAS